MMIVASQNLLPAAILITGGIIFLAVLLVGIYVLKSKKR